MFDAANVLAYSAQLAALIVLCAGLPRLLRLAAPAVQHAFWRALLVVCLLLPFVQPWRSATVALAGPERATAGAFAGLADAAVVRLDQRVALASYDVVGMTRTVLIAGVAIRLAWLSIGLFRLRRMRRRATDPVTGFEDLHQAIGASAPVLWSGDVRHPVTFGLLRPVILLPIALRAADLAAQRAVIAHELHHVRRRDWGWVVAEEIVRSIFWFHPAMWWLVSRVQLARETVVDELTILVTNARRTYLDALLAFADDTGLGTTAFSARRHLFHRVMLLSKEGHMSSTRVAFASLVLIVALGAGTAGAVAAFPLYGPPHVSSVQADEDLQKLFAQLKATLAQMERTKEEREALLQRLESDSRLIQDLQAKLDLVKELQQKDPARALPPPPPPPMPEEYVRLMKRLNPIRIGPDMQPPRKVYSVNAVYPPDARVKRIEGDVIVEIIVDTEGKVAGAQIKKSATPELDKAAVTAARQWKFEPLLMNGTARAALMQVTVSFRIR
jgi:TonB family protein